MRVENHRTSPTLTADLLKVSSVSVRSSAFCTSGLLGQPGSESRSSKRAALPEPDGFGTTFTRPSGVWLAGRLTQPGDDWLNNNVHGASNVPFAKSATKYGEEEDPDDAEAVVVM